jgi:hypothetical protein
MEDRGVLQAHLDFETLYPPVELRELAVTDLVAE